MIVKVLILLCVICAATCECARKKFCFPKHWQSDLSFVNVSSNGRGPVQIKPESGHIYVDHIDQKLRVDIFTSAGKETLLVHFKEKIGYVIVNHKCTHFTASHEIKWCTPGNANISKPYRLGYKPNISVVDYGFHFLSTHVMFSATNNAPIAFRMFGTLSGEFSVISSTIFENYLPTKPDPKVFVVPKICRHHNEGYGNVWETLTRRPIWELMSE